MNTQATDPSTTAHAVDCPDCEVASLIISHAICDMPQLQSLMMAGVLDQLTRAPRMMGPFLHHLGALISQVATKASIYALHQVVRLEDGSLEPIPATTQEGLKVGIIPMLCLACVIPEPPDVRPDARSKLRHTCGK